MKIEQKRTKVLAKKLWHIVEVLYYTFHKTISKHKLMLHLNLRLLLERSKKVAVKAIGNLLSTSHQHHRNKLYRVPREVEFNCNNTPFQVMKNKGKHHDRYDQVSDIVKTFEMLNSNDLAGDDFSVVARFLTPKARPVRVTDSPFPIKEEVGEGGSQVDREAEEFIKRFYEQLWLQE